MLRIALTFIPLFFVACGGEPTAPYLAQLTAPQSLRATAVTPASSTHFDGFVNFCQGGTTYFRATPAGTAHFGVANENRWVTGNPLIDGVEHNTGAANGNPFGQVVVSLHNSLKPDVVNGTWEIVQQFRVPDGISTGVGHGTGDPPVLVRRQEMKSSTGGSVELRWIGAGAVVVKAVELRA